MWKCGVLTTGPPGKSLGEPSLRGRLWDFPDSPVVKNLPSNAGAAAAAAVAKSLQSCQTLCDPIDGSPPGSPVPGILQARTSPGIFQTRVLEWGAIAFSGYVYEEKINTSMTLVSHIFN